jgi:hypothetical protein
VTRQISATIVVAGDPALLAGFRRRVNELLDSEFGAPYRELHTSGRLDYRIRAAGVPYPQLVAASAEFPDLVLEVAWENAGGGTGGSSTIRAGQLTGQTAGHGAEPASCELRVERDGTLVLGLGVRRRGGDRLDEWLGYAITASRHCFFRLSGDGNETALEVADGVEPEWAERWTIRADRVEYARLEPREPIDEAALHELDRVANEFVDEWIWFEAAPAVETAVERQRYEGYGLKVNAANVRAAKLMTVLREDPQGGYILEMADGGGHAVAAALARHWLQQERH